MASETEGQQQQDLPTMRFGTILATTLATLLMSVTPDAGADLIVNGSFEQPVVSQGNYESFAVGSTGITGWTVIGPAGSNVDLINDTFMYQGTTINAESGVQSVDLSGTSDDAGDGLSQTVATSVGTTYELSFWVGRASYTDAGTGATDLSINGSLIGTYTNPNTTPNQVNWMNFTYDFIATTASTDIAFTTHESLLGEEVGLDNVSLNAVASAVPEPSSLYLAALGAAAMGGLALVRRKARPRAA
jgi:hypothetical protein